ncbi:hypothetical protein CL651_000390 [bacterium]|nr:hypothetical protein [bacterium]|tara:strand:+ start:8096 stop:8530 length:435 start_codon:yes stop_codon:yes gene_type:complete
MLNIGCLVVNEDYDRLKSTMKENKLPHFTYTLTVTGAPEGGTSTTLKLYVVELVSSNLSIGFTLPPDKPIDKELEIIFTTQPTADVKMPEDLKLICDFSEEKKDTEYAGENLEKLEYIGYSLEKFYETKKATFYLFDYEGITKI